MRLRISLTFSGVLSTCGSRRDEGPRFPALRRHLWGNEGGNSRLHAKPWGVGCGEQRRDSLTADLMANKREGAKLPQLTLSRKGVLMAPGMRTLTCGAGRGS